MLTKQKLIQLIYNKLNLEKDKNLKLYLKSKGDMEWFGNLYNRNNQKFEVLDFLLACFLIDEWSFNFQDRDYNVFMRKENNVITYAMEDYLNIEENDIIDFLLSLEQKGINIITNDLEIKICPYPYN